VLARAVPAGKAPGETAVAGSPAAAAAPVGVVLGEPVLGEPAPAGKAPRIAGAAGSRAVRDVLVGAIPGGVLRVTAPVAVPATTVAAGGLAGAGPAAEETMTGRGGLGRARQDAAMVPPVAAAGPAGRAMIPGPGALMPVLPGPEGPGQAVPGPGEATAGAAARE
jgi:hypothetical protein